VEKLWVGISVGDKWLGPVRKILIARPRKGTLGGTASLVAGLTT